MSLANGVADLHLHTTASDGTNDVAERVQQATDRGLETIAVTDHDVIGDGVQTPTTTSNGVEVVAGVEVRADLLDTKIEILGYYVDPEAETLDETLRRTRRFRTERNRELVERLAGATGLDLDYMSLAGDVDGNLGRPHLAERLLEAGVVDSIGEAFDRYLGSDGEAYVPMQRLSYTEVIDAVHGAGGAASLAHPGRIRSDRVPEMLDRLVDAGLDGIEVWYPYGEAGPDVYADVGVAEATSYAEEYDLIPTGGSDCHGEGSGKFRIGTVRSPPETVGRLRAAAAVDREGKG